MTEPYRLRRERTQQGVSRSIYLPIEVWEALLRHPDLNVSAIAVAALRKELRLPAKPKVAR